MASGTTCDGPATPDGGDPDRLRRLLGGPDLAWLVDRARRRLELGRPLTGVAALAAASPAQRSAVDRLLGRRPRRGDALSVRLEDVEAVMAASGAWPAGLADALRALGGPVVVREDAAAAEREAWAAAWAPLRELTSPPLRAWWANELASGLPRRLAGTPAAAADLARDLLAILERLPAGGVAIGSLAHAATGSAHALDAGPLPALALRAARVLADLPAPPSRSAAADRETWAAVGVVRDELASTVLVLGLPAAGTGSTAAALAAWNAGGQPSVLTLRHLRLDSPAWLAPAADRPTVFSCENPVVLAAIADRCGAAAPVVCTSGQPSVAALAVLTGLRDAGWQIRHHGDLDPAGVRITELLVRKVGARPWRMGADDYRAAVAVGLGRLADLTAVEASWDRDLAPAMAAEQQVVEEEAVLELLVSDVAAAAGVPDDTSAGLGRETDRPGGRRVSSGAR